MFTQLLGFTFKLLTLTQRALDHDGVLAIQWTLV